MGACVSSLLAQTLREFELILVDDGSTDGSGTLADIFAGIDSRVKVIHQKNAGVSAARNAGLAIALGDYIGFVDADDFAEPEMYENLYAAALAYDAEIAGAGFIIDYLENNTTETVSPQFETDKILGKEDILRYAAVMHSSKCFLFFWRNLYSRRLIRDNGIRFDEDIAIGEDTLFCMECFLKAERAVNINLTAYHYRIHPASCMQKKYKPLLGSSLQKQFEQKLRLCDAFLEGYKPAFYKDMASYTIKALLPAMLANIYLNDVPAKKGAMRSILQSGMLQKSFADFDIKEMRSKSLDWLMLWCAKNRLYFSVHILCKYVLYKN